MRKIAWWSLLLPACVLLLPAAASGACTNDERCDAVDLGKLDRGMTLGDRLQGLYDNNCAGSSTDPNPSDDGGWFNDAGVWFRFETGNDPSPVTLVEALNDPEGTGDEIDLQLAVFRAITSSCDGVLRFEKSLSDNSSFDGTLPLFCLRPNTVYFILVDGGTSTAGSDRGVFGLQVRSLELTEAPDYRCTAQNLGPVPEGGATGPGGVQSNFCATSFGDPLSSTFATQVTVWYRFQAPSSGHVIIDGRSEGLLFPLGIQLALYRPVDNDCNSSFEEVASGYEGGDPDEQLQVTCLYPGETYYLMVDGFGTGGVGMFELSVRDAGDITPVTTIDTVLCAGERLQVGTSVYTESGNYVDTLQLQAGCDSIIRTNLTVLTPVSLLLDQTELAVWEEAPGSAVAKAGGGTGNYAFEWCDGTTGSENRNLIAGEDCFLRVEDTRGCSADTTFSVSFTTLILPAAQAQPARCAGDDSALFSVVAGNGIAPYTYRWESLNGAGDGQGELAADGQSFRVDSLPAGDYRITLADAYSDTSFVLSLLEPAPLQLSASQQTDASCYGSCDGALDLQASGGTGAYRYAWSNGQRGAKVNDLCSGSYSLTLTDENACITNATYTINEPPEFIATASELQSVRCFGEANGRAEVTTNGQPAAYTWSNGRDSALVSGLSAGAYTVIVTNVDGCADTASVQITQPEAPLSARITETESISCHGAADGRLEASISGPYESIALNWSDGIQTIDPGQLPAGIYQLQATNERGCTAIARYVLNEPAPIRADLNARDITCLDPDNGGEIRIGEVSGGKPAFTFSLDGIIFQQSSFFAGLFPGSYEVVIQDAEGCEAQFPVTIAGPPDLRVNLGGDRSIQLGDTLQLLARANSSNLQYTWESAEGAFDVEGAFVEAVPLQSKAYRVTVRDTVTLCTATDMAFITVRKDRKVFVPTAFSPNGDGINDRFSLFTGQGTTAVRWLRIFSREGALVYEAENLSSGDTGIGWDGRFRGQMLSSGVYVYAAEIEFLDGVSEIFKGEVVLMR